MGWNTKLSKNSSSALSLEAWYKMDFANFWDEKFTEFMSEYFEDFL